MNNAQNDPFQCGAQPSQSQINDYVQQVHEMQNSTPNFSAFMANASIPIYFWVNMSVLQVAPTNEELVATINTMNSYFNFPNNARFTMCGVSYLADSRFYSVGSNEIAQVTLMNNTYRKGNAINIYLLDAAPPTAYANFPGDPFSVIVSSTTNARTLSHEMGHFFGLFHTFNELNSVKERVIREVTQGKTYPPNWDIAGDYLKGTPADANPLLITCIPNIGNCTVGTCNVFDDNQDQFNPDYQNIMSYHSTCRNHFSNDQQMFMNINLQRADRIYLLNANCEPQLASTGVLRGRRYCSNDDTPINIKNAKIYFTNSSNSNVCPYSTSDNSGYFSSCPIPKSNGSLNIAPVFDSNPKNGVTTFDIALISKHVLGVQEFTEPFILLAADVDNSGEIDATDMLYIRRLILAQISSFPKSVTSWRFVPQYFLEQPSFLSAFNQNPFNASYQGYCYGPSSCNSYMDKVTLDLSTEDAGKLWAWTFRPFKVGDVDCSFSVAGMSAEPVVGPYQDYSSAQVLGARVTNNRYQLRTSRNISFRNAEEKTIVLKAKSVGRIAALQLGLRFLKSKMSIKDIEKGDFNASNDVFDVSKEDKGELRALWFNKRGEPKDINIGTVLLKTKVKANANIDDVLNVLNLDDNILKNEFYDARGNLVPMDLEWELTDSGISTDNNLTVNIFPNPFKNGLTFEINSPINEMATITISNIVTGQSMVLTRQLVQGINSISLNNTVNLSPGMLTYSIVVGGQVVNGSITKTR